MQWLAQEYGVLPSEVLRCTPGELYLNLKITGLPDEPGQTTYPRISKRKGGDDPTLTALFASLKSKVLH